MDDIATMGSRKRKDSSESSDKLPAEVKNETSDENPEQSQIDADICIKSTLKKKEPKEAKEAKEKKKKKVQWMDFTGKDLVEIKEFDSCEEEEEEEEELDTQCDRNSLCIIL